MKKNQAVKKINRNKVILNLFNGFSKLSQAERESSLKEAGILTDDEFRILTGLQPFPLTLADKFIENSIGYFPLPLGIAMNLILDGKCYIVPMAVEETSVIAGLSKMAKWIREKGEITTKTISTLGIGQIHVPLVKDFKLLEEKINSVKSTLIDKANNEAANQMVAHGGGVKEIMVRQLRRKDNESMAVIHVLVDTRDAMGANTINQVCEFLKPHIEKLTGERCGMCILSNLTDTKITRAEVNIPNIEPELGRLIEEGSLFAQVDPYRAATNNKGVMNGIDAVLIATGNDWRAGEAGIHAYATLKGGQYTSITRWFMHGNDLRGIIEAPIILGTVGGVTRLHPTAKICLKLLGVKNAEELARVVAAVGLVQNLAALRALVTQGINQGHMKLHTSNIALAVGATDEELPLVKERLVEVLKQRKMITREDAVNILRNLREQK